MKAPDIKDEIDLLYRAVANPAYLEDFLTLLRKNQQHERICSG
ncbi:hypothetical protein [Aliamphritea spongicola]|nr:hypothetical protein [Aliamphritea spongicola]